MSVSSRQALACRRHALLFRLHSVFRLRSPVVPWPALLAARPQKYLSSGSTNNVHLRRRLSKGEPWSDAGRGGRREAGNGLAVTETEPCRQAFAHVLVKPCFVSIISLGWVSDF